MGSLTAPFSFAMSKSDSSALEHAASPFIKIRTLAQWHLKTRLMAAMAIFFYLGTALSDKKLAMVNRESSLGT
jgi:hypothetical protein